MLKVTLVLSTIRLGTVWFVIEQEFVGVIC